MSTPDFSELRAHLSGLFSTALKAVAPQLPDASIVVEKSRQAQHGDYACNLALQLARPLRAKPRDIAEKLIAALPASPLLEKTEIAHPSRQLCVRYIVIRHDLNQISVDGFSQRFHGR
jgi:arginyl-tRNA synthetase